MLHLLLVIHNHQPLGNLPDVFRKAYDIAYGPFLDVVRKHPGIRWALHTSGCLWEWLETEEPGYLDALREEHAAGRLEFLMGGMWEPVQPLIDKNAFAHQFSTMRGFLSDRFDVDPVGSWTTERVWEPSLAGRLSNAGVRYTLLDDSQLRAGLPNPGEHQVWGYYRTEYNGQSVAIFPINEHLRYLIPFHKVDETIGYLEHMARELPDNAAITYGDDGEKFGMWPETFEWVFKKGWLDEFLGRIEESDNITTTHPSEYMKIMPHPRQRVYITTSSYREMGIWNLYPRRNLAAEGIYKWIESNQALKEVEPPHIAGLFRSFLARYPESCYMHERVQELVRGIIECDPDVKPSDANDASPYSRALWHALRAQCNCPYWHGVFGGLYLNYLRFAIHREILTAEAELAKADDKLSRVRYIGSGHLNYGDSQTTHDAEAPILIARDRVHWVVDPMTGQVISAGSVERKIDVIDVLARRFEAYHATMREAEDGHDEGSPASIHEMQEIAPAGWKENHGYDKCRRGCFTDRVMRHAPSLDQLVRVEYDPDLGPEWGFWGVSESEDRIEMIKTDGPWRRDKILEFKDEGRVAVMRYSLSRSDGNDYKGVLLLEFNIGLLAGDAGDRYHLLPDKTKLPLSSKFESNGSNEAVCIDEWSGVKIVIGVPDAEWMGVYPVSTLSRGEGGLEMNYQGTSILFRVPIVLEGGTTSDIPAEMEIVPI